ncbi:MAG: GGDEF domain-containing protein [Synergistales bacterium]|nr:GGDEF domain-containing protein [Synergistales bacterium]
MARDLKFHAIALALVRLIRQDRSWPTVLDRIKLTDWIVLPLRRNKFPALNTIKEYIEKLTHMQGHDALTGLANRDLFSARLQEALARNEPVAVIFMDLDGFKSVNDTLGHDMGDHLLQKIARRLKLEVSERDTVARMGGDEFTIVVPSPASREAVEDLAARILRRVSKKAILAGKEISVTASIGISLSPDDGFTVQDLMKHADVAMYTAKDQGKNRFSFRDSLS